MEGGGDVRLELIGAGAVLEGDLMRVTVRWGSHDRSERLIER